MNTTNNTSLEQNKSATTAKTLFWINAVVLAGFGIYSFVTAATVLQAATALGWGLLIAGVIDLIVYFNVKERMSNAGTVMANSIVSFILALAMLFGWARAPRTALIYFGIWGLCNGVLRAAEANRQKADGVKGWGWAMAIGVAEMICGVVSFFNVSPMVMVGLLLILAGAGEVVRAVTVEERLGELPAA